jgi:hypothetical protein
MMSRLTQLGCVDVQIETDPFFVVTATKNGATPHPG